jgi:hypothetical protein
MHQYLSLIELLRQNNVDYLILRFTEIDKEIEEKKQSELQKE